MGLPTIANDGQAVKPIIIMVDADEKPIKQNLTVGGGYLSKEVSH